MLPMLMRMILSLSVALLAFNVNALPVRVLQNECTSIQLSTVNNHLLTIDGADEGAEWTAKDGKFVRSFSELGEISKIDYVAAGKLLVVQRLNGAVELLDSGTLAVRQTLAAPLENRDLKVSLSLDTISLLSRDRASYKVFKLGANLMFDEVLTGGPPQDFEIISYAISPDGKEIAILDDVGGLFVRNIQSGALDTIIKKGDRDGSVYYAGSNHLMVSTAEDANLFLTNYRKSGSKWLTDKERVVGKTVIPYLSGDGYLILDDFGFVRGVNTSGLVKTVAEKPWQWMLPVSPELKSAVAPNQGDRLYTCARSMVAWNQKANEIIWSNERISVKDLNVQNISKNGMFAVVADWSGRSAVWNVIKNRFEFELPPLPRLVFPNFSGVSNDGNVFAEVGASGILSIFRRKEGSLLVSHIPIVELDENTREAQGFLFQSDAEHFLTITKKFVASMHLKSSGPPDVLYRLKAENVGCTEFTGMGDYSPDGSLAALGCKEGVAVVDIKKRSGYLVRFEGWEISRVMLTWAPGIQFSKNNEIIVAIRRQAFPGRDRMDEIPSDDVPSVFVYNTETKSMRSFTLSDRSSITSLAYSPRTDSFFVGDYFGGVNEYNLGSGSHLNGFNGFGHPVYGLRYNAENDLIMAWGGNSAIKIIRPVDGKFTESALFFGEGHYIALDDKQRLVASYPGVMNRLGLQGENVSIPEISDSPSRLGEKIPGREAYPMLPIEKFGQVKTKETEGGLQSKVFEVNLSSTDFLDGKSVKVVFYKDGRLVDVVPMSKIDGVGTAKFTVPASPSYEKVEIGLFADGYAFSEIFFTKEYEKRPPPDSKVKGVFVGINKYRESVKYANLTFAESDAEKIAAKFRRLGASVKLFPADVERTSTAVTGFIEKEGMSTAPDDVFVMFLSGHGVNQGGQFYFVAADASSVNNQITGAISGADLSDLISRIPARTVFLVLDACNAGFVSQEVAASYSRLKYQGFSGMNLSKSNKNIYVVAASPAYVEAREGVKGGGGILTKVMLDGFENEQSKSEDKKISAQLLLYYVAEHMPEFSRENFKGLDIRPVLSFGIEDFNF
ncbi:TPA: caspase family protein [Pseudomonas putida]|nr:caspase family protein [Pseudomonas putida]